MHPLEHRRRAGERPVDVAARHAEGGTAVGLPRGTDPVRSARKQGVAVHLEEAARVVVDVDEFSLIDIEDHDHLGRMLDQGPVAGFALAHRLFGQVTFGDVANADDVAVAPIEARLADRNFHRDARALLGNAPSLVRGEVHMRIVDFRSEAFEKLDGAARVHLGQQEIERAAEDLRLGVSENPLAGGIERFDVAGVIDGDDGILDVVEDRLQMRCGLLADLAGERLRLIRHELHGAHDAAPLEVDSIVMGADGFEQRRPIELSAAPSRLGQLALEQPIQASPAWRRLAPNGGRDIA